MSVEASGKVLTFLIADIRGYTSYTRARGDEGAARLAGTFAEIAREGVEQVPAATGPAEGPAAPPAEQGSDGPMTLAQGSFASLEHTATGTALVIELEDGRRFLRLDGLETSSGPDLRVILTDQPLSDDWDVWDDGELVDLGPLKGNIGSSNYEIPTSVDLGDFETAVIWCRRFSVGFGVAPLESPPA